MERRAHDIAWDWFGVSNAMIIIKRDILAYIASFDFHQSMSSRSRYLPEEPRLLSWAIHF
jgi:hypothetical protein